MKCLSCDCILTDREAVRKYKSGEFLDLCDDCLEPIKDQIHFNENPFVDHSLDVHDEETVAIDD